MTDSVAISIATLGLRKYGSLAAFREHLRDCAETARRSGSRLLILPELSCLGLLWSDERAARIGLLDLSGYYREVLTPLYPAYCEILSRLARDNDIVIAGASYWHERGDRAFNTGFVFAPDGSVLTQDKLHLTRGETAIDTDMGNDARLFEVAGVRMGMAICYDIQFPELIRCFVDTGAEVILCPSLTDQRGVWRVRHCAHARAIENQCYVCVSPLVGELGIPHERPLSASGTAIVTCPIDQRLGITDGLYTAAAPDREGLLHVKLDLARLRLSRSKGEIRPYSERRPRLYADLGKRLQETYGASSDHLPQRPSSGSDNRVPRCAYKDGT